MKEISITTSFTEFENFTELDSSSQKMMQLAIEARKKAYAPYSRFKVGAALQLKSGEILTGNNQENAAYPSGLCAERTAIYYAGAQYPNVRILEFTDVLD